MQKGMTLVEMVVVMACFSVVAIGAYEIISQMQVSNDQMTGWNNLTQWSQRAIDEIQLEVTQGRTFYQNDTFGQSYQAKLQLDEAYPVFTTTRLPLIDVNGTFHQDTAPSTRTGNALLFVRECAPYVGLDGGGNTRRIDVYSFCYYYLSEANHSIGNKPTSLRLIRWKSSEFADYNQVMAITATDRTGLVDNLYNARGIRHLWISQNLPNSAFYPLDIDDDGRGDTDGDHIWENPDGGYVIQRNTSASVIGSLGLISASVSWNQETQFWTPDVVPKFAVADLTGVGFPHGFEVQAIGPTAARQVLVRLVLAYFVSMNQTLFSTEATTVIALREY